MTRISTTLKQKSCDALYVFAKAIDGRFGKYKLIPKIRKPYQFVTYGTLVFLFIKFIFIPFMEFWSGVVSLINYLYWGIE